MTEGRTLTFRVHFRRSVRRQVPVDRPKPQLPGRVPRVARFMALAIRFEQQIRSGAVVGYAAIARLGHVDRSRVTQIMDLLQLAPDIQEEILFLPLVEGGPELILLRDLLSIARLRHWRQQRPRWHELRRRRSTSRAAHLPPDLS